MNLATMLLLEFALLIALASAIAALARSRGTSATIAFAILATLACTATGVWVARSVFASASMALSPEFTLYVALADFAYAALPIGAITITALWLARRPSRLPVLSHLAVVIGVGLLASSVTVAPSRWVGADFMNAVQ